MFKKLIYRPIALFTVLAATLILGIVVMRQLPVSLVPEVDIPLITVKVTDSGRSAREINKMAIEPLRYQLAQTSHLNNIEATSKDGSGVITMSFDYGASMDLLFVEVNEKIDRAISSLPSDMERPRVMRASATDIPAFYINVTLKEQTKFNPDAPSPKLLEMSTFADEVVLKRIEQLNEVAMVDISGVISSEILITPDSEKLKMAGISEDDLIRSLQGTEVSLGNLMIRDGEYSFNVRFESKILTKTDIEEAYIKIENRIFQFKDLASVNLRSSDRSGIVLSDGEESVTMAVIKHSDAKMADLKGSINKLLEHFEQDYPDLSFTVTRDQTALLDYSINNLISNILAGGLLACIVIFFFMQDFRSPFLVVFTIPTSLIISFLFFYMLGITINIISLAGLVLGIGMMVDNSIVTVDNITYKWKSGLSLADAAVEGTKEVFMPMLSSVMTTCAVFIPLVFLSGISGALFYDQAMAVTITLFSALIVSLLVLPTFYYLLYRRYDKFTPNRFLKRFVGDKLISVYEKILKWNFRRRWVMWSIFLLSVVGSVFVFNDIKKEKLPQLSYNDALLSIEWNERISAQENSRRCDEILNQVEGLCTQSTVMSGIQQFIMSHTKELGVSEAIVYIKSNSPGDIAQIEKKIRSVLNEKYPNSIPEFTSSGNIFDMIFSSNEATLIANIHPVKGGIDDLSSINKLLEEINNGLYWVDVPQIEWQEHIEFVVRPDMMALYDVSYNEILSNLQGSLSINKIMTISSGSQSLPIVIGNDSTKLSEIVSKGSIERDGFSIPLDVLLRQTNSRDLKTVISGGDGEYYKLNLTIDSKDIIPVIDVVNKIVKADNNFTVQFSGSYFSNKKMISELLFVLLISILLLYFILSSQFESLTQPFIILFELVIDIFGAVAFLYFIGESINLMSLIGIVVMCGIVINDSILKVDTINRMRKSGVSLKRSIMVSGARRLKPILMTSLTTILSMLPFLIKGDMGSDLQYPLSIAVISGMVVGTLVSVFFVPLVYFEIYRKGER